MKLYEYKGKIYCEEDISIENDDYKSAFQKVEVE